MTRTAMIALHRLQPRRLSQTGFSLIEIMIALVIGMAAVIIMMQMLSNSDAAKRITVGGNDAQTTGTIALYNLERDIRSAGVGINAENLLGCKVRIKLGRASGTVEIPLAPVSINDDVVRQGDPNTDTLLVVQAKTSESPDGDLLIAASSDMLYMVTTPSTFQVGDQIVLQNETRADGCTLPLSTVKTVTGAALALDDKSGEAGVTGMAAGSVVYNLVELVARAYVVRGGNLLQCDFTAYNCSTAAFTDTEAWEPVASNIVALRAQYGRDLGSVAPPRTGQLSEYNRMSIDELVNGKGLRPECAWARTVAVRVGLVARSAAYDKLLSKEEKDKRGEALLADPTWSGATDTAGPVKNAQPIDFDLSDSIQDDNAPADEWRKYRYKVFETTIPLRNLAPQGGESAC